MPFSPGYAGFGFSAARLAVRVAELRVGSNAIRSFSHSARRRHFEHGRTPTVLVADLIASPSPIFFRRPGTRMRHFGSFDITARHRRAYHDARAYQSTAKREKHWRF